MGSYIGLNLSKGQGRFSWEGVPNAGVHFRPDDRLPVSACGIDFTGQYATTHPITNGTAFDCDTCRAAWEATQPPTTDALEALYNLPVLLHNEHPDQLNAEAGPDFVANISLKITPANAKFVLHWTDGCTGQWIEEYDVMSVAVARLALLIEAVEADMGFTTDPAAFTTAAFTFFQEHL